MNRSPESVNAKQVAYQPTIYSGTFVVPSASGEPKDTFLQMCGWFKVKSLYLQCIVRQYATSPIAIIRVHLCPSIRVSIHMYVSMVDHTRMTEDQSAISFTKL